MGAPMATFKVEDPAEAFLAPHDYVAVSFWIISIAMIAATVFFFAESATVKSHWKTSLHVGGLVTMVAAVHYMYMREYWVQLHRSPIVYRYIDWTITVPLQMIEFNLILRAAGRPVTSGMFWKLLLGTVAMLAFGYAGEANQAAFALPGFIGGMLGWFFILYVIFSGEGNTQLQGCSEGVKKSYNNMKWIVSIGWSIYPLGYVLGTLTRGASAELLNLVYNLADFVNKIGFVLSCWSAAKEDAAKEILLP